MTRDIDNEGYPLNRRDVLKGAAAAGVVGFVGIPAFSGSAAADDVTGHPAQQFDLYGIDHFSSPNKLVTIDSNDLVPGSGPITVSSIPLSQNVDVNTVAAHPNGSLFSTDLDTNRAFTIDPGTGQVTHFGNANSVLGGIAGSAIVEDGTDKRWFGITHGGASPSSTLFEIDLDDGSTTQKGGLFVEENGSQTPVVATHLGLGVNFLTNELWGVIGDPNDSTSSSVFRIVDVETGEVELTNEDALTGGRSVGAALGPCAEVMYVVRKGNNFYGYDVGSNEEYSYGTLEYDEGELDFDSLAVPYGFECETACEPCKSGDLLAKYEFECVEHEIVGDEEICVDYDFVFEKGDESLVSYTGDSYEDKDGEEFEPVSATFSTDYCSVWQVVKAGQDFVVQELTATDEEVTATNGDSKHAISFVAFFCSEEDATAFADSFPSKGRGGKPARD